LITKINNTIDTTCNIVNQLEEALERVDLLQDSLEKAKLYKGLTPKEAIDKVELWETTGESQLLKQSKMQRYR